MLPALDDVQGFRRAIEAGIPQPLAASAELDGLLAQLDRAEHCLAEMDEKRLVVALFGGTGVGKSTLLNALAGVSISAAGDRRPTTDRVVCYRHRGFPIPAWLPAADLADPPPPAHALSELKGIVLLDLPDVDSRAFGHREIVHRLLPHLDLLIVVTSIDKYGDRALYRELGFLPQSPKNLAFVLNAVDRLAVGDIVRVREDFVAKLERFSPVQNPRVFALSARDALQSPDAPKTRGFDEFITYLHGLGGDRKRQEALAANAATALQRIENTWRTVLPPNAVAQWFEALDRTAKRLPDPSAAQVTALQDHLAEAIGVWAGDRALRASWFPIGPLHFLARRLRPGRSAKHFSDPLATGDPCRSFTEQILARPLRLAAHEAERALRPLAGKLTFTLPKTREIDPRSLQRRVASWWDRLRTRSDRWAWKIRQHALPGLFALCWFGWIAAESVGASDRWWETIFGVLWAAVSSLSPTALAVTAASLLAYYLLVYPYYLYRLERNVHREAVHGAHLYLKAWRECYDELWGTPLQERVAPAETWWREAEALFAKLRIPAGDR